MTPEEQKLVAELFDRLATLEGTPRDPDALRLIQDGLRKAPNALYPLVQTVLVQDEALKQANSHIQQLEQELGYGQEPQRPPGGFLDNMRSALFGKQEPAAPPPSPSRWGSVPSVRPGGAQGYPQEQQGWGPGPAGGAPMGGQYPGAAPMGGGFGGGGSFLGTAAASAAGVIGGALMMDSIRSMMGHRSGGVGGTPDGGPGGSGSAHAAVSPWNSGASGGGGSGNLSRDAGVDDIGRGGGSGASGGGGGGDSQRAGLFGGNDDQQGGGGDGQYNDAQYDVAQDDSDFDDGGFDGDDGGDDNA